MPVIHPWYAFTRPLVRDLAYALACPPVITAWPHGLESDAVSLTSTAFWQAQFTAYLPRLEALEKDPKPLNRFLGQHLNSFRLGFRFEALMLFWLLDSDYHDYALIAHNVQLFTDTAPQETLGELDFLVKNKRTHEVEHWELAIKFFLGEPPYSPAHWKGLKGSDNLAHKSNHLQQKSFRYDAITVEGQLIPIDKRVAIIKGRFYEPLHLPDYVKPSWLNPALPMGKWLNCMPTEHDSTTQEQHWRAGKRVEWFTKRDIYDSYMRGALDNHAHQTAAPRRIPLIWRTGLYFDLSQPVGQQAVMLRL